MRCATNENGATTAFESAIEDSAEATRIKGVR